MIYLGIAGRDLAILIVGYAVLFGVGLARGISTLEVSLGLRFLIKSGNDKHDQSYSRDGEYRASR